MEAPGQLSPARGSARGLPDERYPDEGYPDERFPAEPYPGVAPGFSFVHLARATHPLRADPTVPGGWRCGGVGLDAWLTARGAAPLAGRVPVLTFGSNRCPAKLTWLREHLGLAGPVVVLRARVDDVAAVWAAGFRARDGARPATLTPLAGARETHAVWFATPAQVAVLDACEGRGERYDLGRLSVGSVRTEDGAVLDAPWTYGAASPQRAPLLVHGRPVRCREVDQERARALRGEPAVPLPGVVTPGAAAPDPDGWPDRVFVPGPPPPAGAAWSRLAPYVVGDPRPARVVGTVRDTGHGPPALRPGPGTADGVLVRLRDVAAALPEHDAYAGPEYRRERVVAYSRCRASRGSQRSGEYQGSVAHEPVVPASGVPASGVPASGVPAPDRHDPLAGAGHPVGGDEGTLCWAWRARL